MKDTPEANILIAFHTPSNAGYAMAALEKMFFNVACKLFGSEKNVHFSFRDLSAGEPKSLPPAFKNVIALNYSDVASYADAASYISKNNITCVLCFDVQPNAKVCSFWRSQGVKKIVSYWGSTISDKNTGLKLLYKKVGILLNRNKPDHFIFESQAMRSLAVHGRGIPEHNTSVIPTGIDITKYKSNQDAAAKVRQEFGFPQNSKIVFYSGHMERRKGVHVIVESAIELIDKRDVSDVYFLICGNRPGEELTFLEMLKDSKALKHVIFAGYRNDLPEVMPGCDVGVVASTGWDSFPMSTLEMAASGLPVVVSRLQGLVETIEDGVTGYTFEPGNSIQLADKIMALLSSKDLHAQFSTKGIERIHGGYSVQHQFNNLSACLSKVFTNV